MLFYILTYIIKGPVVLKNGSWSGITINLNEDGHGWGSEQNIGLHGYVERRARHERVNRYIMFLADYFIDWSEHLIYIICKKKPRQGEEKKPIKPWAVCILQTFGNFYHCYMPGSIHQGDSERYLWCNCGGSKNQEIYLVIILNGKCKTYQTPRPQKW